MTRAVGDDRFARDQETGKIHLPLLNGTTNINAAINFVFPSDMLDQPDLLAKRAILCGTNDMVDKTNAIIFYRLPGQARTYYSTDRNAAADAHHVYNPLASIDILNARNFNGVPPHQLQLKVGAVCFVERNLSIDDGLMHNSKVVVTAMHDRYDFLPLLLTIPLQPMLHSPILQPLPRSVEVRLLSGPMIGHVRFVPRITFKEAWPGTGIILERHQIPLRLAYAMTFNKSQGQTLERVLLDLRNPVFAHGQLYVGMSRVGRRDHILALLQEEEDCPVGRGVFCHNIINPFLQAIVRSMP
jgi:ATP-dependent DNA helicase PIF1